MIGVEERDHNGIHVVRLHYTADPAKRSTGWLAQARAGFASERDFRREMEIDWTIASGVPVHADDFVRDLHIAKQPLTIVQGLPIILGYDFGLTPACVVCQLLPNQRLVQLAEFVTWDGRGVFRQQGIERLAKQVQVHCNRSYPGWPVEIYCDPAGWAKAQTDEKTCVAILQEVFGMDAPILPGAISFEARRAAMCELLSTLSGGQTGYLVSPDCTMTIEGLGGAYRYKQSGEGMTLHVLRIPDKNAWSHVVEALQYVVTGVLGTAGSRRSDYDEEELVIEDEPVRSRASAYY